MTVTKSKSSTAYNEVNKAYLKSELRSIRKQQHRNSPPPLSPPTPQQQQHVLPKRLSFGTGGGVTIDDEPEDDMVVMGGGITDHDDVTPLTASTTECNSGNENSHHIISHSSHGINLPLTPTISDHQEESFNETTTPVSNNTEPSGNESNSDYRVISDLINENKNLQQHQRSSVIIEKSNAATEEDASSDDVVLVNRNGEKEGDDSHATGEGDAEDNEKKCPRGSDESPRMEPTPPEFTTSKQSCTFSSSSSTSSSSSLLTSILRTKPLHDLSDYYCYNYNSSSSDLDLINSLVHIDLSSSNNNSPGEDDGEVEDDKSSPPPPLLLTHHGNTTTTTNFLDSQSATTPSVTTPRLSSCSLPPNNSLLDHVIVPPHKQPDNSGVEEDDHDTSLLLEEDEEEADNDDNDMDEEEEEDDDDILEFSSSSSSSSTSSRHHDQDAISEENSDNTKNTTATHHHHDASKLFCTEHIGNVLLDEFDGTTVLCRVCGDKASGFHYGVHSCEGCKGFFRRSIQQKIQYRPCTKNQQCSILRVNRNRCQYCRLKKCIAVGMSRDAVRFGRVPKREKAKILAAMQQSHHAKVSERALSAELEDTNKLTTAVVRAHMETCEFTKDKVQKCYNTALIKKSEDGKPQRNTEITLACPLNPHPQSTTEDFSQRFSPAIRGVVEFAKRLPGFSILSQDDQVTLLKAGVFEILLVRLACMFKGNTMLCINGELLERETISAHQNARFLLDSMFKFAEQFNKLGLSDEQIGLFCAVVVMAPDRPGLRNVELVTRLQSHLRSALHSLIPAFVVQELDRKIPDLRTLNTLHSEKLLAFKMEEQATYEAQQQQASSNNSSSTTSSGSGSPPMTPMHLHRSSSSSLDSMDRSSTPPGYDAHHHHHHHNNNNNGSNHHHHHLQITEHGGNGSGSSTVSISPRRLSNNSSNGSTGGGGGGSGGGCPYKSFPRGLESPSGDSGIESGACSSPARSEQDLPIVDERQTSSSSSSHHHHHHNHNHHQQRMEDMPVLKRALQAPPIVDTNVLMNEAYRVHKKFRYSEKHSSSSSSSTSSTGSITAPPTPYSSSSSTHSSTSSSPPPPPSPNNTHVYSPSVSPYRPQSVGSNSTNSSHHHHQQHHGHNNNNSSSSSSLSPPPPPPHQLYPQLASALTNPRSSSSSNSSSSSEYSSYSSHNHHHHAAHPTQHHNHHHQFKSPLQLQHSTLAMKLNEKPKHMTEDQQVTSELLHSIIMRGGDHDDEEEDDVGGRMNNDNNSSSPPPPQSRNGGGVQSPQSNNDSSQVPLNLSKKIVC